MFCFSNHLANRFAGLVFLTFGMLGVAAAPFVRVLLHIASQHGKTAIDLVLGLAIALGTSWLVASFSPETNSCSAER